LFAPACAPFANPEAIVNGKLTLSFLAVGYDVQIIGRNLAGESTYDFGSRWEEPWLPLKNRTHLVQYQKGTYLTNLGDSLASAVRMGHPIDGFRWASHALELALELHKRDPFDIVLSRSGPDAAHLSALHFVRKTGKPWLANWNDPCSARMPPPYSIDKGGIIGLRWRRFYQSVGRRANFHTFPSARLRRYISEYVPNVTDGNSRVVPHVALETDFQEQAVEKDTIVFCHAGRLDRVRDPIPFIEGLFRYRSKLNNRCKFKVKLIGLIDPAIQLMINRYSDCLDIQYVEPQDYLTTLNLIASSDVAVIIEAPCDEGIFLPSKMVDYVQTGRPILAVSPLNGTLNDLIGRFGGGIAADCRQLESIEQAIGNLSDAWRNGTLESEYSSAKLKHIFSPTKIIEQYKELFQLTNLD